MLLKSFGNAKEKRKGEMSWKKTMRFWANEAKERRNIKITLQTA